MLPPALVTFKPAAGEPWCSCSVLVLKKLGGELLEEFINVIKFLHDEEDLNVIVEQHMHKELVRHLQLAHTPLHWARELLHKHPPQLTCNVTCRPTDQTSSTC